MNRSYFVLFCVKNMRKPILYTTKSSFQQKTKEYNYSHQIFQSQIQAQKFLFPKKIAYLLMKKQFLKQGIDIETMQKIQSQKPKINLIIPNNAQNQQSTFYPNIQLNQNKQQKIEQSQIKNIIQKVTPKIKKISQEMTNVEQIQPKKLITEGDLEHSNQQQLQQQKKLHKDIPLETDYSFLNFQQMQNQAKQIALNQITKKNIKTAYRQIINLSSGTNNFVKSTPKIRINSYNQYIAFFDGCAKPNPGQAGAGYIVLNSKGETIFQRSIYLGYKTNNQSQFFALVCCLIDCKMNKITNLKVLGDSQLVIKGLTGKYNIQDKKLKYFNILAKYVSGTFQQFQIHHIQRAQNKTADKLSVDALKKKKLSQQQFVYL